MKECRPGIPPLVYSARMEAPSPTPPALDAHQHFWIYDAAQYPWIPPRSPLHADHLPAQLLPHLQAAGLQGCVAVQARQNMEESRWLLTLADHAPEIRGVVGWVDLCSAAVSEQLAELAPHPRFVGVRHVVQDEPDDRFLLREDFQRGLAQLAAHHLAYDLLVIPRQLPAAVELVPRFPQQIFVLDHLAKPFIRTGDLSPWREHIIELAKAPNVFCKISGMITEADPQHWQRAEFAPFVEAVVNAFGWERLMYGSDWPVCRLAAEYTQVHELAASFTTGLSPAQRAAFFGGNAARAYRLST